MGFGKYGPGSRLDSTVLEILTTTDLKMIGFSEEEQKTVLDTVPGIGFAEVPADRIPGQAAVTQPVSLVVYATRSDIMSDEEAYEVVKAVYENRQDLIDAWGHLADFDFKAQALKAEELGLPLHPGAKKFWESLE